MSKLTEKEKGLQVKLEIHGCPRAGDISPASGGSLLPVPGVDATSGATDPSKGTAIGAPPLLFHQIL